MKKLADDYENPLVTRSKQILTKAFFELLKENPHRKITVSELCKKAGMARPTFYSHYESIEDIPMSYFDKWLHELEHKIKIQLEEKGFNGYLAQIQNQDDGGLHQYEYWCNEVDLVKRLQNAGYENVVIQAFKKTYEVYMRVLVAPNYDLPPYFQSFLQTKAALVSYELYKYWINTGMQLSVQQLNYAHRILNNFREIEEMSKIMIG